MMSDRMGTTKRVHRFAARVLTAGSTLVLAAVCSLETSAEDTASGDVGAVMRLLRAERDDDARAALVQIVETDARSTSQLHAAGRLALEMEDRDLLQRVRAAAEAMEADGVSDWQLDLALGYAYLGLAESHLRNQSGGSSVALLFADAEARAKKAGARGAYLAARTRYAQGDVPGALAATAADETAAASLCLLAGTLFYERGAAMPVGPDGRPTPAAAEALAASIDRVTAGIAGASEDLVLPRQERGGLMTRAWAAHRLGLLQEATDHYVDAYAAGGRNRVLVVRGLQSLYARDRAGLIAVLERLAAAHADDAALLETIARVHLGAKDYAAALIAAQRRLDGRMADPVGWTLSGEILLAMQQWGEAREHFAAALREDSTHDRAAFGMEQVARGLVASDFDRALATYEELLTLRPEDPFVRNNLGFILRERVSAWTDLGRGAIQRLKPDAPDAIRKLLQRCRDVYGEAVALIPASEDESRDLMESWNLAGIVNDYGLMLHYFADIQDAPLAEAMYLRALRMTEDSFKDTYSPNLQRLYAFVLPGRELTWYRVARRCKDAVMAEASRDGRFVLVPDPRKRAAAARDEAGLRARIVRELGDDAAADGLPWPPKPSDGDDR